MNSPAQRASENFSVQRQLSGFVKFHFGPGYPLRNGPLRGNPEWDNSLIASVSLGHKAGHYIEFNHDSSADKENPGQDSAAGPVTIGYNPP